MARNKVIQEIGLNSYQYQKIALEKINNYYQGPLVMILGSWINNNQRRPYIEFIQERKKTYGFDIVLSSNQQFPNDGHPNQIGHQKIAEDIFNYLIKKKIISCN